MPDVIQTTSLDDDAAKKSLDERVSGGREPKPRRHRGVEKIIGDKEAALRGPPAPELWRLPKVLAATGLGKSQLLDAVGRGVFPAPVRILEGGRAVAWVASEVIEFIESRIAARDNEVA